MAYSDSEEPGIYSQKRGLLRPHSSVSGRPVFRNIPLFGFLTGLLLFFCALYFYQSQNSELNARRYQAKSDHDVIVKLRDEITDLNVRLESQSALVMQTKKELENAGHQTSECVEKLLAADENSKAKQKNAEKSKDENRKCSANLNNAQQQLLFLNESLQMAQSGREAVVAQLKRQINSMEAELKNLKHGNPAISIPESDSKLLLLKKTDGKEKTVDEYQSNSLKKGAKESIPFPTAAVDANRLHEVNKANVLPPPPLDEVQNGSNNIAENFKMPKLENILKGRKESSKTKNFGEKNLNDGGLVMPGGKYIDAEEDDGIKKNDEAAVDFENDEKRMNEPDT